MSIYQDQATADYLDAMADSAFEQAEVEEESIWWDEEISKEEKYACDFYNERYVMPD